MDATEHKIRVHVETSYVAEQSDPAKPRFVFAYTITIRNEGQVPARLLTRHWIITDANGKVQEVKGEGVVGVQPVLNPGEKYQYVSGCNLRTEIGKMHGTYTMENLNTKKTFDVNIPTFEMIVPFKMS